MMSGGLKTTFLVHFVVALAFGLLLFLAPPLWGSLAGYEASDPTLARVLGAALLGLAVSSWLGYRADRWDTVRIVVAMEIVFDVLAALAVLYGMYFEGMPVFGWVVFAIYAVFAVAWIYFYRKHSATA